MSLQKLDKNYLDFLNKIKEKIRVSQLKAAFSVNAEMIFLYWEIGRSILAEQEKKGWGAKVIDQLSKDLNKSFSNVKGFSSRNLKYMRKFAEYYPDFTFVQEVLAQITWYHNLTLIEKIKDVEERKWYIRKTVENGWSRDVLVHQIEGNLYKRQEETKKITNFKHTLPKVQSDLANQTLKDPYLFDFLTIGDDAYEKEMEKELVKHIRNFLLELGSGFAFVGNQYHLEIEKKDYYIDLLFYHLNLRCYIVIELKVGEFKPEYAGKLNFYLSAADTILKQETDNNSIGILLCKTKNKILAEYALRDLNKPIGVSEYKLVESVPKELKTSLPSIKDIEAELSRSSKVN